MDCWGSFEWSSRQSISPTHFVAASEKLFTALPLRMPVFACGGWCSKFSCAAFLACAALTLSSVSSSVVAALVALPEGFHHDIDETSFSIGSQHACALEMVSGVEFGGKPVCWGNKKFSRLAVVDVRATARI